MVMAVWSLLSDVHVHLPTTGPVLGVSGVAMGTRRAVAALGLMHGEQWRMHPQVTGRSL